MYLEVMQIRNVIPWIRSGPISVQDLSPGDLYVDYEGNPFSMFNCFSNYIVELLIIWFTFIMCPTVYRFLGRIKIWISNVLEYDFSFFFY